MLEGGGAFENTPPTTTAHSVHPGQAQGGDSHNAGSSGSAVVVYPVTPSLVEALTEDCEWGIHKELTSVFLLRSITKHVVDMCNFAITYVTSGVDHGEGGMSAYPTHYFDIVWASPLCTEYNRAKSTGRRIEGALDERHHH